VQPNNLLGGTPIVGTKEQFNTLLKRDGVVLEQISSPAHYQSEVYLQKFDEWVLLLQGEAEFSMGSKKLNLKTGDSLLIPAHTPHQIHDTSANPHCIWLTLHLPTSRSNKG